MTSRGRPRTKSRFLPEPSCPTNTKADHFEKTGSQSSEPAYVEGRPLDATLVVMAFGCLVKSCCGSLLLNCIKAVSLRLTRLAMSQK